MRSHLKIVVVGASLLLAAIAPGWGAGQKVKITGPGLQNTFGTYAGEPRSADRHVDIARLIKELTDLKANTYHWLIWHTGTDWEDLQRFLPLAREKGIRVWVTLVPPSESPPRTKTYSEPFRLDYERWATEIAQLSQRETNLVAWSVDDFSANGDTFTPERLRGIRETTRAINPQLSFVPCCYFKHVKPEFAKKYQGLLDGILFPYRHESAGANLKDFDTVENEVVKIKELFGGILPVVIDVYATRHSRLNDSTAEYVQAVMNAGRRCADGVLIYCHQQESQSPAKYHVIKQTFQSWARAK